MNNLIRGNLIEIDEIFENLEDMMSEESAKEYQLKYNQVKSYFLDQQKEIEKQQKEIKELKSKNNSLYGSFTGGFTIDNLIELNNDYHGYIDKDKIRELLENYEEDIHYSIRNLIEDLKKLIK